MFTQLLRRLLPTAMPIAIPIAILGVCFSGGVLATEPRVEGEALSLQQAQTLALTSDQGIEATGHTRDADALDAGAADQLPDPTISVGLQNLPLDNFSMTRLPTTMLAVSLSQTLPPGDTLAQQALAADARTAAATADITVKQQVLLREVRRFWLTVYRDEQTIALLQHEKTLYQRLLRSAQTAYSAGRARATDLVRLQVKLAELDDAIAQKMGDAAATRARLARWIGGRAEAPWPKALPDVLEKTPAGGINQQPELAVLRAQLGEARAGVGVAKAAFQPQFGVEVGYGVNAGTMPNTGSIGVSMSLPIFTGERQVPRLAAAQQRAAAQQLALDNRAAELQAERQSLIRNVASFNQRIEGYDTRILPQLRQVTQLAQSQFGAGGGDFTAIVDAEQALIQGQQQRLDLTIDRASSLIDLRYLVENPS
ncbi:MAG: TolC family protein [Halothiobacillaceae bacterium]|nr:TolC family protein [Halothiobacillaceae bacterium]HUN00520.1 TolC family protein [Halothiobacillus sp.]